MYNGIVKLGFETKLVTVYLIFARNVRCLKRGISLHHAYHMLKSIYYQVSFLNVFIEFRCLKHWRKSIVHRIFKIYVLSAHDKINLKMFPFFFLLSCIFWLRSPTYLKVDQWSDESAFEARNVCIYIHKTDLIFHVQHHKTVCIFSLLPQNAYLRRNMNYGALLRPPGNIKAFLFSFKTPYNKTDVSVFNFVLPILNFRYISNHYTMCIIHFV